MYLKGFTDAVKTFVKTRRTVQEFEKFIQSVKAVDVASNSSPLPLMTLLMCPIVRLYEYELLIKELWEVTPPDHVDFADLSEARRFIIGLNQQMLPTKQEAVKIAKALNVVASIKESKEEPNQADVRLFFMTTVIREKTQLLRSGPCVAVHDIRVMIIPP